MSDTQEKAIFAGGCFWGMQDLFRKQRGVVSSRVGYTGGEVEHATYRNHRGHAEALEIIFDTTQTSYRMLLKFFFQIHDPTTLNRQGNDVGDSYRSAIFYCTAEQKNEAEKIIAELEQKKIYSSAIVTQVIAEAPFWEAEEIHQDYLERRPNGYTCHFIREHWKL